MSTTPLDTHRQANATSAQLAEVLTTIAERGVEFVYFQAITITGRVVGKVAPAKHFERLAVKGVQQHQTAVANLQGTRAGVLLAGGVNAPEYTAVPDLETFAVLPWDTSFARVFCRLYEPDHLTEGAGAEFACDTRGLLRRMHAGFTDRTGLELRTGCEPEMTWRGEGLEAHFRPGSSPAYHIEHLERNRPIVKKVVEYAQALGLDMVEGDYEDEYQVELNFMYDHADLTADRLVTYRQICKQVARELGIEASFMPKPATGMMGNGCHHNFSLWRDGVNVLADPDVTELHLTDVGKHALGGLLSHSAGAMLINGSTVTIPTYDVLGRVTRVDDEDGAAQRAGVEHRCRHLAPQLRVRQRVERVRAGALQPLRLRSPRPEQRMGELVGLILHAANPTLSTASPTHTLDSGSLIRL